LDADTEEMLVPDVEYSTIINLPTAYFQKIIRDLNGISDRVEIRSVGNDLIFSCEGNFASSRIFRSESDGNMEFIQNSYNNDYSNSNTNDLENPSLLKKKKVGNFGIELYNFDIVSVFLSISIRNL
jgi:hypothetical protein